MSLLRLMTHDISRTCPYIRHGGKCRTGCWSEPHCITGEPLNGWPWQRLLAKARKVGR